jgi:signal transduction histidine kinase
MGFTLTPYVFKEVQIQGDTIKSIPGAGIPLFAGFTSFFSVAAIYVLIRKIRNSKGEARQQLVFMMRGILVMLGLIIGTIMIPVAIFQNQTFIPFSPLYALIFLGMTAYAIVKFHLFNIKVIATEAFTLILWVILFSNIITANTTVGQLINGLVFTVSILFGINLIRSVRQEIKQREQLEILDKQLVDANVKLKILDQARAEFITIASHQLRTPPATIKWYLAAILDGDYGKFDDTVKEQLRKTASTNNSMIALIDDLLNASRIERGKMEFVFVPTNLTEITQITVDQLLPQAEIRKLSLIFEKPKVELPIISADKEKLRQVINNLIDNASKYTEKGKIEVTLSQTKKDVIFKVTDSGRGVPPDQLMGIFQKYERGNAKARNSSGLGLGLYVAKVIIEQHKGKIWVESAGEGKGSSFIFSLPIKAQLTDTVYDLAKGQTTAGPVQK